MNAIVRRSAHLWWIFLSVCSVAILAHQLGPAGVGAGFVYLGLGVLGAVAIVVGVRLHRPSSPSAWYLMGIGLLLSATGNAILSSMGRGLDEDALRTVAAAAELAAYPFIFGGLLQLIRARRPRRDLAEFLDSAILTAGWGLLVWVLLLAPATVDHPRPWLAASLAAVHPVADVLVLFMLIRLNVIPGARSMSLSFLSFAIVLLVAADVSAALSDGFDWPRAGADALALASSALWGAAALHPSMHRLSAPAGDVGTELTARRLVALAVSTFVAPVILVVQRILGEPIDGWLIGVAILIMFALVIGRMKLAIDQIAAANRERIRAQGALAHQAAHDALTDLPNRAEAGRFIAAALGEAPASDGTVALLFLDLDDFKRVNDMFGHSAGDEVLRVVARRLRESVRAGDVACRVGGDEFVILLTTSTDEEAAIAVADRLVPIVSAPVAVAAREHVTVGASIGVAFSHGPDTSPDSLLNEADAAMYRAKQSGPGRVAVFDDEMRREWLNRTELERDLSRAISDDQLVVHYQPIVDLASGSVHGFEALVRWPRRGRLLSASEFVPIAEQSELVCELGAWVLRQATQQLAVWNDHSGSRRLSMAVNISGRHITAPRVLEDVHEAVAASGIDPTQLVIEITETALIDDSLAVEHLQELRHDGVAIGIDDFGTGYASIRRLESLPIDIMKVDRRFLDPARPAQRLLGMIVDTGRALGLRVIVEGVETEDQLALLRSLGCEAAQGYLLGRPVHPDAITVPGERRSLPWQPQAKETTSRGG